MPTTAQPQHLCPDKGDEYQQVRSLAEVFGSVAHIRPRGEETATKAKNPAQKTRRWVIERTSGWMNRFCSPRIRWAKIPANHLGLLHFTREFNSYRAAGLFG